jgi:hypothetical protein
MSLSRRDFIKLGAIGIAGGLASAAFRPIPHGPDDPIHTPKQLTSWLGRTTRSLRTYTDPTVQSKEAGYFRTDEVATFTNEVEGPPPPGEGKITWWESDKGWVHSAYIQPVENRLNTPLEKLPPGGFLGVVTVPYTIGKTTLENGKDHVYRFYYTTTYWVHRIWRDDSGVVRYNLLDDLYKRYYVVRGEHIRQVMADELSPLSVGVADKRIEVDLTRQMVTAYEDGQQVYQAMTATGRNASTPTGNFRVERKQPSRHMTEQMEITTNFYDLPGVPWVCFISWTGISLHGTYWHNNYGRPQSHGCINLTPKDALWFYRWSDPILPAEKEFVASRDRGTKVVVF